MTDEQPEKTEPKFTVISADESSENETDEAAKSIGANDEAVSMKISQLEQEHRDLDNAISTMEERLPYDRLTLQRMKKRKLALKDKITQLRGSVLPDIIA